MNNECEVIRDLLPLYADAACSSASRELVEEHLRDCPACRELLDRLREEELECELSAERDSVLERGARWFRRRSAAVGSGVSGLLMVPVIVCLALNFRAGLTLDWYSVALAALLVAASLIVVPLIMPEDKAFWTFCAFCASLLLLLGVICLYSGGHWFWIASSAVLFGLSVFFLPFLLRARPVRSVLGSGKRLPIVLGADALLLLNLLNAVRSHGRPTLSGVLFTVCAATGVAIVILEILKKGRAKK